MKAESDMSPEAISRRLHAVDALFRERRSLRVPVDFSPAAVSKRLRRVSELHELCSLLGKARSSE